MRLRLNICRHELPPAKVLFGVPDSPTSVSKLLELINHLVPLESVDWGLEDYVAEHGSFECLHYSDVHQVLKDDDELTYTIFNMLNYEVEIANMAMIRIRPLQKPDTLSRRLSGRYQVAPNGARLVDGIPFGRQYLKRPSRPNIHIPPLKRRRIDDSQEVDIYEEDTCAGHGHSQLALPPTSNHDEISEQAENLDNSSSSLKNASVTSPARGSLRSGKGRRNVSFQTNPSTMGEAAEASDREESAEEDSDESDFQPGGKSSSSESDSEESEEDVSRAIDHASPGSSLGTKVPAESTDDTSSSSSEADEESSSQSSSSESSAETNDECNGTKTTDQPTGTNSKELEPGPAKSKDGSKSSAVTKSAPGYGSRGTRTRNRRRKFRMKRTKCLHLAQMVLWLVSGYRDPDSPDRQNVQDVEKKAPLWRCVREKLEQFPEFESLLGAIANVGIHHDEFSLFENYHDRIQQFANKGDFEMIQSLLPPPLNTDFANNKLDENDDSHLSNRKALLLDKIGRPDTELRHELESNASATTPRDSKMRERSSHKTSRPPPKKKYRKDEADQELAEGATSKANELFDPNEWKEKLAVGVIECRDEELSLPPPPFPFVKWWWNDGENPHNLGKKQYGNKRGPKRKKTRHVDQFIGVNDEGDGLQYDEVPDENQQRALITEKENGNVRGDKSPSCESEHSDHDDIPDLPGDLAELEDLHFEECHAGTIVVFRRLEVSQSTNWQPAMSPPRTATITSTDANAKVLLMRLAKRDRERPNLEVDEDGNQLYDKFGTLEDGSEDGDIEVAFSELVDPKILQIPANET